MSIKKTRLDVLLVERGLAESREKARAYILSGLVSVNGNRVDKVGHAFAHDCELQVASPPHNYVSRGGLKLEKALQTFDLVLDEKVVIDVGASTGGFTDCALQNGASQVISVDVGSGQLAWKLRQDPRVQVLEKTNIRHLNPETLVATPQVATIDVSFISLRLVLPVLSGILPPQSDVIALIKPQFEAGKEAVSRGKGVIRDASIHTSVIAEVLEHAKGLNWGLHGLTFSPITGPEGNMEFIAWWKTACIDATTANIDNVVLAAHKDLG